MFLLFSMADGYYTDLVGLNSYANMHFLAVGNWGPSQFLCCFCEASNIAQLILGQQN